MERTNFLQLLGRTATEEVHRVRLLLTHAFIFDTGDIGFRVDPGVHHLIATLNPSQKFALISSCPEDMKSWLLENFSISLSSHLN